MPVTLWVAKWEESERGWGRRFDGFLVTLKPETHIEVLQAIRDREREIYGARVPEAYSLPVEEPRPIKRARLDYREIESLNERGYFWSFDSSFLE